MPNFINDSWVYLVWIQQQYKYNNFDINAVDGPHRAGICMHLNGPTEPKFGRAGPGWAFSARAEH